MKSMNTILTVIALAAAVLALYMVNEQNKKLEMLAAADHTHAPADMSGYAEAGHSHEPADMSGYATTDHSHDIPAPDLSGLAAADHTHDGVASADHTHSE